MNTKDGRELDARTGAKMESGDTPNAARSKRRAVVADLSESDDDGSDGEAAVDLTLGAQSAGASLHRETKAVDISDFPIGTFVDEDADEVESGGHGPAAGMECDSAPDPSGPRVDPLDALRADLGNQSRSLVADRTSGIEAVLEGVMGLPRATADVSDIVNTCGGSPFVARRRHTRQLDTEMADRIATEIYKGSKTHRHRHGIPAVSPPPVPVNALGVGMRTTSLEKVIEYICAYLKWTPMYRRPTDAEMAARARDCSSERMASFGDDSHLDDLVRVSAYDEEHFRVESGVRKSPVNPSLTINTPGCIIGAMCVGLLLTEQLDGQRRPDRPAGGFLPVRMVTVAQMKYHYETGSWPSGDAGNTPCMFCYRFVAHFMRVGMGWESGFQWLPFVAIQYYFNPVDTQDGYKRDAVLVRSPLPSSVIRGPIVKWNTSRLRIYFDENMGLHRIDESDIMVWPLPRGCDLGALAQKVGGDTGAGVTPHLPPTAPPPSKSNF